MTSEIMSAQAEQPATPDRAQVIERRSSVRVTVIAENRLTATPTNRVSAKPLMIVAPVYWPNQ